MNEATPTKRDLAGAFGEMFATGGFIAIAMMLIGWKESVAIWCILCAFRIQTGFKRKDEP